jgi:hypothetical protein
VIRSALVLALCLSLAGCASSQTLGRMRRATRDPGQKLLDLPDKVAKDYACKERVLPWFKLERNEINPKRVEPGSQLNHRIEYALCPEKPTEVVTGTLTTRVRFKGEVVLDEQIPDFEIKPGRWRVDAFVRLPEAAESGVYALEIHFQQGRVRMDESLTFGVDG